MSAIITNEMLEQMSYEDKEIIANLNKRVFIQKLAEMLTQGKLEYEDFMKIMRVVVPREGVRCFTEEGWKEDFMSIIQK